jgi:hypothetical protein
MKDREARDTRELRERGLARGVPVDMGNDLADAVEIGCVVHACSVRPSDARGNPDFAAFQPPFTFLPSSCWIGRLPDSSKGMVRSSPNRVESLPFRR